MSSAVSAIPMLPGVLDLAGAEALLALLQEQVLPNARVRLDGAAVTQAGTAGLQLLLAARQTLARHAGTLELVDPSPGLLRAIADLGLDAAFGLAPVAPGDGA
jgi:anti-anti-sigma regulatory factor